MSQHGFAKSYGDLIVYQKARAMAREIYELTKSFPKEERYSLTDQVRRSSRSVGAQVAEAWAKRRYPNHFISKLTDADGEKNETEHWIDTALDCGYLVSGDVEKVRDELQQIGKILHTMIRRSNEFKGADYDRVREDQSPYGSLDTLFS